MVAYWSVYGDFLPTMYSYKLENSTYWTFLTRFQAVTNKSLPATFPAEFNDLSDNRNQKHVKTSQIQAGSKHNVPLDHLDSLTELVLQVCVSDVLRSLTQLPQHLLQSSHAADDAAWTEKDSMHFQITMK
jgi:hypothetical protein